MGRTKCNWDYYETSDGKFLYLLQKNDRVGFLFIVMDFPIKHRHKGYRHVPINKGALDFMFKLLNDADEKTKEEYIRHPDFKYIVECKEWIEHRNDW